MKATWIENKLLIVDPISNVTTRHLLGYTVRDMVPRGTKQTYSYGILDVKYKKTYTVERARELVENKLSNLSFDLTII